MLRPAYLFVCIALWIGACSPKTGASARSKSSAPAIPAVSYAGDIAPILVRSCSPCHYPSQQGKKESFETYAAARQHIDAMIVRVMLPETDARFMPFKNKKPALTEAEIALLKNWAAGGFGE